ncbi:MAG: cyclopropane-fatty-acyl-phospholipid synthase [Micromonosporaceae bacterium]|jgi:cyclopropane-fatty-acyl-phospholipid synthase|nr:cyclopropane-fatty-acyl-phospholipid synthase [Micromonosporaceae bacterium]
MFERRIVDAVFRRITRGGVIVRYWDGETRTYGPDEPYFTLTLGAPSAVSGMLRNVTLGFGEAYMDGRIEIDGSLADVGRLMVENQATLKKLAFARATSPLRSNSRGSHREQIQHHYDLGNDFYALWLDASLTYSCAYFRHPDDSLETAQEQKVAYLLRKLKLRKGQRLLDIGSGWGALMITAAKVYGIHGLGVTLSDEQLRRSREAARQAGVDNQITFELCDYRHLAPRGEKFDRIISVGMFEHVGRSNHERYYDAVASMLSEGGVSVLHTISSEVEEATDPWIEKYIFPGGSVPSTREIVAALPRHNLRVVDYENLRLHYAMTLEEWRRRYEEHRETVTKMFDERFYRMWNLWLACSSAAFRYGAYNLSQFVLTKGVNNDLPLTREAQNLALPPR